jgi:hypothetical protein
VGPAPLVLRRATDRVSPAVGGGWRRAGAAASDRERPSRPRLPRWRRRRSDASGVDDFRSPDRLLRRCKHLAERRHQRAPAALTVTGSPASPITHRLREPTGSIHRPRSPPRSLSHPAGRHVTSAAITLTQQPRHQYGQATMTDRYPDQSFLAPPHRSTAPPAGGAACSIDVASLTSLETNSYRLEVATHPHFGGIRLRVETHTAQRIIVLTGYRIRG